MKLITSRFPSRCRDCKSPIGAGESVWWERGFGSVCDGCFTKATTSPVAAGPDGDDLIALGTDAVYAELSSLCDAYSQSFDGTPDEIFNRSEKDVRYYERVKAAIDLLAGELKGREVLAARNAQENAADAQWKADSDAEQEFESRAYEAASMGSLNAATVDGALGR